MIEIHLEEWREDMGPAFYKLEGDILFHAPNFVFNPNYTLVKEDKDKYTLPQDGWYWFDTETAARQHFALPPIPEPKKL